MSDLVRSNKMQRKFLAGTLCLLLSSGIVLPTMEAAFAADGAAKNAGSANSESIGIGSANAGNANVTDSNASAGSTTEGQPIHNPDFSTAKKDVDAATPTQKLLVKPGMPVVVTTQAEDLVPTDDPDMAKKQVDAYPDNAEAAFIYAVSLTRTARIEEALKEIRRARRLAEKEGGPVYFDKMIAAYEDMLKSYPEENRVRYGLAWAYYMKAYLLAQQSKKEQDYLQKLKQAQAAQIAPAGATPSQAPPPWLNAWASQMLPKDKNGNAIKIPELKTGAEAPHIKGALEVAAPAVVPQVKQYYQSALSNLDELIKRKPDDVWAIAYRAHLNLEYTGDLESSMIVWRDCAQRFPDNPAAFFFLGEGYLKQGNLKECLSNISRAIALRGMSK